MTRFHFTLIIAATLAALAAAFGCWLLLAGVAVTLFLVIGLGVA